MWPDDVDLPVTVEAAFGANLTADPGAWSWTDLSSRLGSEPISAKVGQSSGSGGVSPGTCSLTLLNDDGALSPLHPMSPYWPNVARGTPLRVRLRRAEDAFARAVSSSWGTADSGQVWTTGGTAAADFSVAAGVARHSHPTVNNLRRTTLATSLADSEQVVDIATSALLTGAALVTGFLFRFDGTGLTYYWLRCEFNSGGTSVMLKLSKCVAGGFTDLAVLNPVPGLAYAANSFLRVRASVVGSRLAIKVWNPASAEPAGWQLTATDNAITAPGAAGVQSWLVLGNTNALPVAVLHKNYSLVVDRFTGFADQWEPTYLPIREGESASAVRLTASGLLRRLGQGTSPLPSALRAKAVAALPVAYWPMEGGPDLSAAESAVPGGVALRTISTVAPLFGEVEGPAGSGPLPDLSSHGVLVAPVQSYTHAGQWQVEFWFRTDTGNSLDFTASVPLQWDTPGSSVAAWDVLLFVGQGQGNPGLGNIKFDISGYKPLADMPPSESFRLPPAESIVTSAVPNVQGTWRHLRVAASQAGANIQYTAYLDGVALGTAATASTLAPVTAVTVNPLQGSGAYAGVSGIGLSSVGHVAVHKTITDPGTFRAGLGYVGELATDRIARLCAEVGVAIEVVGVDSEPMGPQRQETLLELLSECVAADGGILSERQFGLLYRARDTRYNQAPSMTVDLAGYMVSGRQSNVLVPTLDDQEIRNDWTVSRPGGGEARVTDETHVSRNGRYDDSVTLNVATDGRLPDQAGWRVHLGTVDEMRESAFPIDLAANPDLVDGWLSCGVGSRVLRTNPPAQYGSGPLDRLVEGWTETIGPRSWIVQVSPSPAQPWTVAVVDGSDRVAAQGSTLAADLTQAGTSLLLASTGLNGPWTQDPADLPLPMRVGGEQVTASAIAPALLDQFGRTVASGWGNGWVVSGGSASDYSVNGFSAAHSLGTVGVLRTSLIDIGLRDAMVVTDVDIPVVPAGAPITHWVVLRAEDLNNHYIARLDIATSNQVTLALFKRVGGTLTGFGTAVPVGNHSGGTVWRVAFDVHGGLLMAKAWRPAADQEPNWQVSAIDSGALVTGVGTKAGVMSRLESGNSSTLPVVIRWDNFTVATPQTVTLSARAVNGVSRAWPAGTDVDVWQPAVLAL